MRFDTWTKAEKRMFDYEYHQLFADQVTTLKKLYRFNSDKNLCDEINDNISSILFKFLEEQHFEFAESLIESMFLSMIEYDVLISKRSIFNSYVIDLYFYDQHQIYRYKNIVINTKSDLKKMIEMMLYIGRKYDQLSLHLEETRDITSQLLVSGFDQGFMKEKMSHLYKPHHIQ